MLTVKYCTTGGWLITETHIAVSDSLSGILQTKKGSPIPGLFKDGGPLPEPTDCIEYAIDVTGLGCPLYVAAHAKVIKIETMTIVSEPGVGVYGPATSYLPLNDPSWGTMGSAVATWVHPYWPTISGATWISTAYYVEEPVPDSWR